MLNADVHRRQGRWEEALAGFQGTLALDSRHSTKALHFFAKG